jgi:hypothetical protein
MLVNGYEIRECANLRDANLRDANLSNANLRNAHLRNANLRYANLRDANLSNANLRYTDLSNANLSNANLRNAHLRNARLYNADLSDANLPDFQVTPVGYPLYGFKKLKDGTICTLLIPVEANRTASLIGRKCRAEYAIVIEGEGYDMHSGNTFYKEGETVYPDSYNPDINIECSNGIHFFQTKQEAEDY